MKKKLREVDTIRNDYLEVLEHYGVSGKILDWYFISMKDIRQQWKVNIFYDELTLREYFELEILRDLEMMIAHQRGTLRFKDQGQLPPEYFRMYVLNQL